MLVTFGVVAAFVGMDITPEQSLMRFPDIRAARTVENSLYLGVLLLWVLHCLALYRGLRRTSPAAAAYGYTRQLGYHPLLATRADTGEFLHTPSA